MRRGNAATLDQEFNRLCEYQTITIFEVVQTELQQCSGQLLGSNALQLGHTRLH